MNFNKQYFSHVVLNNLRNGSWTALIACANFSPETKSQRSLLIEIGIKPIVSVDREGYDCSVI